MGESQVTTPDGTSAVFVLLPFTPYTLSPEASADLATKLSFLL